MTTSSRPTSNIGHLLPPAQSSGCRTHPSPFGDSPRYSQGHRDSCSWAPPLAASTAAPGPGSEPDLLEPALSLFEGLQGVILQCIMLQYCPHVLHLVQSNGCGHNTGWSLSPQEKFSLGVSTPWMLPLNILKKPLNTPEHQTFQEALEDSRMLKDLLPLDCPLSRERQESSVCHSLKGQRLWGERLRGQGSVSLLRKADRSNKTRSSELPSQGRRATPL
jgi:hypothetical protein